MSEKIFSQNKKNLFYRIAPILSATSLIFALTAVVLTIYFKLPISDPYSNPDVRYFRNPYADIYIIVNKLKESLFIPIMGLILGLIGIRGCEKIQYKFLALSGLIINLLIFLLWIYTIMKFSQN